MNQSSKTHKQKCQTVLPEQPTKTQRRRKQYQPSFRRNPLQDLNSGGIDRTSIDNTSNASSLSSIEAPKGCLRFFLSHSSSSSTAKTPFNDGKINQRPKKVEPFSSKTPKSAPNMRPTKDNSSRKKIFQKPISKKLEKGKRNHPPCLYQWQSGKKRTSSTNEIANAKVSSFLDSSGGLVNNKLKSGSGELKKVIIAGVCEGSESNLTPLSKVASGSGLDLGVDGKVMNDDYYEKSSNCNTDSKSTSSTTKTPPVQPSVSPEIQCGSSMKLMTGKTITPATCYGAGHVVSGVTDKRKCRPRGILAGGEAKALGSFDSDDDSEQKNGIALAENSAVSMLPLPIEASMHWLLSPCDEEDEGQKENSRNRSCRFQRLEERAIYNSPASNSSGYGGFSPDLCNTSTDRSISTVSAGRRRRRSASLLSPSDLPVPEFQGFLGTPLCDDFAVSPLVEETKNRHGLDGENSPFSVGSLGSGNVIQTPQSDYSSDRRVGASWLQVDGSRKKCSFDSELNSVAEHLQMTSLSPKSHASIWDPINSSFQFDSLTMPSNSVDLSKFHKILDERASWFSNSTIENVSQSQMRISWREGLVSRIFEMGEFDCCRYLSDEEDDGNVCKIDCSKSHKSPELNVDAATDHISINGFVSTEYVMKEQGTGETTKDGLPCQPPCSCAESISTDGGGLVHSDDSDWTLWYKNHLFQV